MNCEHPNVINMDYKKPPFGINTRVIADRACRNCGHRWHGPINEIKEYTRAEWDVLMGDIEQTN